MPLTLGTRPPALMITTDILGVLVSAALFAFIRHSSYAPQLKADVGLMFMVAERARGRAGQHAGSHGDDLHDGRPRVVDDDRDSRRLDDPADHPAQDAGRGALLGVDGSARRLGRAPARPQRAIAGRYLRHLHAELRVRHRRDSPVARAAADRTPAAPGAGHGQLSSGRAPRPRRHGRGLARRAPAARARRGDQARAAGTARRQHGSVGADDAAAVRARGAGDGCAELAAHDSHLRLRRHRRPQLLLRDGAAVGPRPRFAGSRVRPGAGRPHALPALAGLPLARRRARARPGAPRRHAGEHLRVPDGARVRLRQGARLRPGEVQRPEHDADDADDRPARDDRHAGVHGARDHHSTRARSTSAPTSTRSAASPTTC